nr:Gip protein [Danio rerio]
MKAAMFALVLICLGSVWSSAGSQPLDSSIIHSSPNDIQKLSRRYAESTIASDISKIVDSMVQKNFVNFLLNQREKKSEPALTEALHGGLPGQAASAHGGGQGQAGACGPQPEGEDPTQLGGDQVQADAHPGGHPRQGGGERAGAEDHAGALRPGVQGPDGEGSLGVQREGEVWRTEERADRAGRAGEATLRGHLQGPPEVRQQGVKRPFCTPSHPPLSTASLRA